MLEPCRRRMPVSTLPLSVGFFRKPVESTILNRSAPVNSIQFSPVMLPRRAWPRGEAGRTLRIDVQIFGKGAREASLRYHGNPGSESVTLLLQARDVRRGRP